MWYNICRKSIFISHYIKTHIGDIYLWEQSLSNENYQGLLVADFPCLYIDIKLYKQRKVGKLI